MPRKSKTSRRFWAIGINRPICTVGRKLFASPASRTGQKDLSPDLALRLPRLHGIFDINTDFFLIKKLSTPFVCKGFTPWFIMRIKWEKVGKMGISNF